MPLLPDDQRHLTAAEGYAALGMYLDANAEIEEIDPEVRHVAQVLTVRVAIYGGLKQWELMRTVAGRLAAHDPDTAQWLISLAYATRRAQSIEAARRILLEAVERLPKEPMLHYNLSCYECQLGLLEVAKARLAHAFRLEPTRHRKAARLIRVACSVLRCGSATMKMVVPARSRLQS